MGTGRRTQLLSQRDGESCQPARVFPRALSGAVNTDANASDSPRRFRQRASVSNAVGSRTPPRFGCNGKEDGLIRQLSISRAWEERTFLTRKGSKSSGPFRTPGTGFTFHMQNVEVVPDVDADGTCFGIRSIRGKAATAQTPSPHSQASRQFEGCLSTVPAFGLRWLEVNGAGTAMGSNASPKKSFMSAGSIGRLVRCRMLIDTSF